MKLMGKQERTITIDGEYIHLDSIEAKTFFERSKAAVSYKFSDVLSCIHSKKNPFLFRLTVNRADGTKIYEFEAPSADIAGIPIHLFMYL